MIIYPGAAAFARAAALACKGIYARYLYSSTCELFKDVCNAEEEEESRRISLHSRSFEGNIVRIVIIRFCTSDLAAR